MGSLWMNFFDNPILFRELRRRMRGKALIYSIIGYVCLMSLSTVLVLMANSPSSSMAADTAMLQHMRKTGEGLLGWITLIQALLVVIIAPTITAGMTTTEKERQTFDFLRVTTISRWMYILGCFLSTVFYVGLALMCALPLLSLTLLYGGVSTVRIIEIFFLLLAGSSLLSSFGLYISSIVEKTRSSQSIVVTLMVLILFLGGILTSLYTATFAGGTGGDETFYVYSQPVSAFTLVFTTFGLGSLLFLLLAARKLFEPEDTRALTHWQYLLIFVAWLALMHGIMSGNIFTTELAEMIFYGGGTLLLIAAAGCFGIGRLQLGDEIWHLKRLLPALRFLDPSIPFFLLLGLLWYVGTTMVMGAAQNLNAPAALHDFFPLLSLAMFGFFVIAARAFTVLGKSRMKVFSRFMVLLISVQILFPIFLHFVVWMVPTLDEVGRSLMGISPIALLMQVFSDPTKYPAGSNAAQIPIAVYTIGGVILALVSESRRFFLSRSENYHYDMPSK